MNTCVCMDVHVLITSPKAITAFLCVIQNWWFYFKVWIPFNSHCLACQCFLLRVGWNLSITGLQRICGSFLPSPTANNYKVSHRGGDLSHGAGRVDMGQRLLEVSNFPRLALLFSVSTALPAHQLDLEGLVSLRLTADGQVGGWACKSIKLACFSDKATGRASWRRFINGADLWHFFFNLTRLELEQRTDTTSTF